MAGPPFISWLGHGAVDLAPPAVFTGAAATLFAFEASVPAMQTLVDTLLNPAGGGVVRYEALLPMAMVSFMDIAKCTSAVDIVGWVPGRECAFWVPLVEMHPDDPLKDRPVFWSPYIFINHTIGLVMGRQTWGWPKVMADIAVGGDTPADPRYGCTTTYFPTLSATTKGVYGSLFQVVQEQASEGPSPSSWRSGAEAAAGLIGTFLGGLAADLAHALQFSPTLPCVALKQFRQAGAPSTACFQAITNSPIEITGFYGGGPLLDSFALEITTCESHPIVMDFLGRAPDPGSTQLPVKFAAWLSMDFQALSGDDIVVTG